jgi:hypothetical protein
VAVILTARIVPIETKDVEMTPCRTGECEASIGWMERVINNTVADLHQGHSVRLRRPDRVSLE